MKTTNLLSIALILLLLSCNISIKDQQATLVHLIPYGFEGKIELTILRESVKTDQIAETYLIRYDSNGEATLDLNKDYLKLVNEEHFFWYENFTVYDSLLLLQQDFEGQKTSYWVCKNDVNKDSLVHRVSRTIDDKFTRESFLQILFEREDLNSRDTFSYLNNSKFYIEKNKIFWLK